MRKTSLLFALIAALTWPASAIELSLEENKAERGNIGYIDMQRLFKTFPDTLRAKENFEELVRQAEEQLNLRKAEILRLRNELSQFRIERDFLSKTPIEIPKKALEKKSAPEAPKPIETPKPAPTQPAPAPVAAQASPVQPAPAPQAPAAPPAPVVDRRQREPETDLTRPSISTLPGFGAPAPATPLAPPALEENARKREPLIINIPGVSTAPIVVTPPPAPAQAAVKPPEAAVAVSTRTAAAPGLEPVAEKKTEPAVSPALLELDSKIASKSKELAAKELEYKEEQSAAEKNLLDLESRRTEILLGRIHRAVQDVARREGVSVVVDKTSILYGHNAVDLTEKVMKLLKGS